MKMTTLEIVKKTRQVCEKYQCRPESYFTWTDLSEMCSVASTFLMCKLRHHHKKANLAVGFFGKYEHCWVEYYGRIYDITATQFKKSPVYVVKANNKMYEKELIIRGHNRSRLMKEFYDWPPFQKPSKKILKKLKSIWKHL